MHKYLRILLPGSSK